MTRVRDEDRKRKKYKRHNWTEAEKRLIVDLAPTHSDEKIANLLNQMIWKTNGTRPANLRLVQRLRRELGITKTKEFGAAAKRVHGIKPEGLSKEEAAQQRVEYHAERAKQVGLERFLRWLEIDEEGNLRHPESELECGLSEQEGLRPEPPALAG